jgi:hypothetical protein
VKGRNGAVASESTRRSSEGMEKTCGRATSCSAGCLLDLALSHSPGQLEAKVQLRSGYLNQPTSKAQSQGAGINKRPVEKSINTPAAEGNRTTRYFDHCLGQRATKDNGWRVSHGHVPHKPVSHGRAPHKRIPHGRASHRRVPHGCTSHRRLLYGCVYSKSPTLRTVVDLSRSELQNTSFCATVPWRIRLQAWDS